MELDSALDQIAEIHRQMSLTNTFRGYKAATTFFTAIIAVAAAMAQGWWVNGRDPQQGFVELWVAVAVVCVVVVSAELIQRCRRTDSPLQRELTLRAAQQFLPCIVIGGMVTYLISEFAGQCIWLLPGLWSIFFGLGLFASRELLPRAIVFVGAFYLLWGMICIGCFRGEAVFSAWSVGFPFAVGQSGLAFVLHWYLERGHEPK